MAHTTGSARAMALDLTKTSERANYYTLLSLPPNLEYHLVNDALPTLEARTKAGRFTLDSRDTPPKSLSVVMCWCPGCFLAQLASWLDLGIFAGGSLSPGYIVTGLCGMNDGTGLELTIRHGWGCLARLSVQGRWMGG